MKIVEVDLKKEFPKLPGDENTPALTAYIPDVQLRENTGDWPGILIFPGGGYEFVSPREWEPVAMRFMAEGFIPFVLDYSVKPAGYPTQLLQACASMAYIRRNAKTFRVIPGKIAVMGFSAGGHLAGSVGTMYGEKVVADTLGVTAAEVRPNALALCYAVLTSAEGETHGGSIANVSLGSGDSAFIESLSIDKRVTGDTPPAYIFATADDGAVPAQSSLLTALAMARCGVAYELHIFRSGDHGLSLAGRGTQTEGAAGLLNPNVAQWAGECVNFLNTIFER